MLLVLTSSFIEYVTSFLISTHGHKLRHLLGRTIIYMRAREGPRNALGTEGQDSNKGEAARGHGRKERWNLLDFVKLYAFLFQYCGTSIGYPFSKQL